MSMLFLLIREKVGENSCERGACSVFHVKHYLGGFGIVMTISMLSSDSVRSVRMSMPA